MVTKDSIYNTTYKKNYLKKNQQYPILWFNAQYGF